MKSIITICCVIFALLSVLFIAFTELRDVNRIQQSEIKHLREVNKKEKDSLQTQLAITRDSLSVAFETIRQARIESQEAHERTQRMIKNYEKIIFVRFSNDAQRDSALSKLYTSFRPIR